MKLKLSIYPLYFNHTQPPFSFSNPPEPGQKIIFAFLPEISSCFYGDVEYQT
jgi:hypothetical protein